MDEPRIYYSVASIMLCLVIIAVYYLRKKRQDDRNRLYIFLVYSEIVTSLICIGTAHADGRNPTLVYVLRFLMVIAYHTLIIGWTIFMLTLTDFRIQLRRIFLYIAPPLIVSISVLIWNFSSKALFYVDSAGYYQTGWLDSLLFILYIYYPVLVIVIVRQISDTLSNDRILIISMIMAVGFFGSIANAVYFNYSIEPFVIAICLALTYFMLNDPAEYYSNGSVFMNRQAFLPVFTRKINVKQPTYYIASVLNNVDLIVNTVGKGEITKRESVFMETLKPYEKEIMVFKLEEGKYIAVFSKYDKDYADEAFRKFMRVLEKFCTCENNVIPVISTSVLFESPADINGVKPLRSLLDKLMESRSIEEKPNAILHIKDLNIKKEVNMFDIEETVMTAIDQGRLEVYYQPIYNIHTGKYTSAEALLRMRDENGKFISPEIFIPIAERSSLILNIGDFVIDSVCRMIAENHISKYGIEFIEVNLSMVECVQENLYERINNCLRKYKIFPTQLNLEITETAAQSPNETADANMRKLNDHGIHFSLDDFGTGYSSLMRIITMPFSIIKLDKSVVQPAFMDVPDRDRAYKLLKSLVTTSKATDAKLLAEGVETLEMARGIKDLGCDYIQGYYFSKPVPEYQFMEIISKNEPGEI